MIEYDPHVFVQRTGKNYQVRHEVGYGNLRVLDRVVINNYNDK